MSTNKSETITAEPINQWVLIVFVLFLLYTVAAPILGLSLWFLLDHTDGVKECVVAIAKTIVCSLGVTTFAIVGLGLMNEQTKSKRQLGSILITIATLAICVAMIAVGCQAQ